MSPIVPSVCFRKVEIDLKHHRKILTRFFWGGMASSASFWLRLWFRQLCKSHACSP